MSFVPVVGEVKKSELIQQQLFWEFRKRANVSGTWKVHVKDSKSCIVNFHYCSFTDVFSGLRANFLLSSYFSINLQDYNKLRTGKILFNMNVEPSYKIKQATIPDAGYEEPHTFPKWHWYQVPNICTSRMFPCLICRKKIQFVHHVSEYLCEWLDWVYRCEYFTFYFTSSFAQM